MANLTNFEEQFPSLMLRNRNKDVGRKNMRLYYIYLFHDRGIADFCLNAHKLEEAEYVDIIAVKTHCVDKQKIRQRIKELSKEKNRLVLKKIPLISLIDNITAKIETLKELLDD